MVKSILLMLVMSVMGFALDCKQDGSQMQMNHCAYLEYEKADKALNIAYKALRKKTKLNKEYRSNLKVSQRLWIKFRDAELEMIFSCEDENKRLCYGSMYPLLYNTEKTFLTQKRTKELKMYIKDYGVFL